MENTELSSPTPAKQAQDKAKGHVGALLELSQESPAGTRSEQDETVLRQWHEEGRDLRHKAEDLAAAHRKPVHFETSNGMLTTPEEHRALVAAGEIKPVSGPTE